MNETRQPLTNQEAFDLVWEHAKKKQKSIDPRTSRCQYRGPNGAKCFVGALISDTDYTPKMEDRNAVDIVTATDILEGDEFPLSYLRSVDQSMLLNIQWIHDNYNEESWEQRLRVVAYNHSLKVPE